MTHCLINHHITGHLVFVLVSTEWIMMCPAIDNPASCEIHDVIHFLHPKNLSAVEIHHELCAIYGQNVMSEGIVRLCCRMFKYGHTNIHVNFHKFHSLFSMRLTQVLCKIGSENS
jgi:hypothetical protein